MIRLEALRRTRLVAVLVGLIAVASASVVGTGPAYAAASYPIVWTADPAPMPPDGLKMEGGGFTGVSCPVVGWCVGIGGYDGSVNGEGLIAVESGGTFASVTAPLPSDASSSLPAVGLDDVSCPQIGSCVIVGGYASGTQLIDHGLIDTLAGGVWTPNVAPLPLNAGVGTRSSLQHVSCSSALDCIATGTYTDTNGILQPVIETESGGTWTAEEAPLPADADQSLVQMDGGDTLNSLSCSTSGSCVAVGTYVTGPAPPGDPFGAVLQSFVDTLSNGAWTATKLPLPSDAASIGVQSSYWTVSCGDAGDCAAVGGYWSATDNVGTVLDTLSSGTWTAIAAPLPADAVQGNLTYPSIACAPGGSCVAIGVYENTANSTGVGSSFIDTLSTGTWTSVEAPLPPTAPPGATIDLAKLACPAAGQCVAVGGYAALGGTEGVMENQVGSAWVPSETPAPGYDPTMGGMFFSNVSCPGAGACDAGITYYDSSGATQLAVEIDPSLPPTTTIASVTPSGPGVGQSAILTADVSANATPTGTVTFWSGTTLLCSTTLINGNGSCGVASWPTGADIVNASYSGNSTLAPSLGTVGAALITTTGLPVATAGVPYSASLTASGGTAPLSWSVFGTLPIGLNLSTSGVITGSTIDAGVHAVTVEATDANGLSATATYLLIVDAPSAITSLAHAEFTKGVFGSFTPTATGYPEPTISMTGTLPAGITFSAGKFSGNPTTTGIFPITITASNGVGTDATQSFTLTVGQAPTITSFTPTRGPVGTVVTINGTNLLGATKVTFNGVKGTITKDTATKIKVKVPSGATTGKIKVVTPAGKISTATAFTVT